MTRLACHTPEQTQLYERGYPYMTVLVDGHKDDKKPEAAAAKVFDSGYYFGRYHVRWPRLVAHAFLRGKASTEPMGPDEARELVEQKLARASNGSFYEVTQWLFTLEAVAGTDVVLDALIAGLEALSPSRRNAAPSTHTGFTEVGSFLAFAAGFLLLRASDRTRFTKRLETLYQATVKANVGEGEETLRGALDLALHGNEGAARALAASHWQYWYWYLNVDDPAVHVARLANSSKSQWVPEARILWLAGEAMFPVYTTKGALRQGKRLPNILGDFGMFRHDAVFSLMVDMVGVKGAGAAPQDYFSANATYVRPKLEKLAKGSGPMAVKAKAAMSLLK